MDYKKAFQEASEKLPRERIVTCACDCALINIDLIKPYTEEFELIKSFLASPEINGSDATRDAARDATRNATRNATDAWSAAYAAWAAVSASSNAARADWASDVAASGVSYVAEVSEESKQKVDQLINDMLSEVKEC